jgi:hypothetical protein
MHIHAGMQDNLTGIVASFFMWTETAVFGALLYVGGVFEGKCKTSFT